MKTLSLILAVLAGAAVSAVKAQETSATWLAQDATDTDGKITVPEKAGGYNFVLGEPGGVTIGGKPDVGTDTKSLDFSGAQKVSLRTVKAFPIVTGTLELTMAVKVSPSAAADGTVMRYGTQWEVRYNAKSSKYTLAVWTTDPKVFSMAVVAAKPGVWQTLKVSIKPDALAISADDATGQVAPKGPIFAEPKPNSLQLGGVGGGAGKEISRPFTGSVAGITILLK